MRLIPAGILKGLALLPVVLAGLGGCLFQEDDPSEPSLTPATLDETGLEGLFDLIDFRIEYTDGTVIDTSRVKITGLIQVSPDSAYIQRIWVNLASTDTKGRITGIEAQPGNRQKGRLTLTLEGTTVPGEIDYELRGDTLIWMTEIEPSQPGKSDGFKETGRYLRNPVI
jgi:hypothetical protein